MMVESQKKLKEKYKKELLFINDKIKPLILIDESIDDFFIDITFKDGYVKFNFVFGHDYFPFRSILYKNNKFFNIYEVEYVDVSNDFLNYL